MKRLALFLGVSLFMACGDDSNNNNDTPVCGDGIKAGSEQCDDGNTTSGDGCSSTCTTETAQPVCGDHHVDTGEDCDDGNTTSGDGCSSTCHTEAPLPVCGNGMVEVGETCDDNNTTANDGCSAGCQVEMNYTCTGMPSVCTLMPGSGTCAAPFNMALTAVGTTYLGTGTNDTTASTNQVAEGTCNNEDTAGGGFDHQWRFVNPVAQKVVITLNSHIDSGTAFDGVIRVMSTACDITTQIPDDVTDPDNELADGCTDLFGSATSEVQTYSNLPAGTYYVDVDGYDDTSAGMYSLTIAGGTATCGNGILEPGEGCDDNNTAATDGCGATCAVEAGYTCTGSPSVCTAAPGSCAMPYDINLALAGGIYTATETGNTDTTTSSVPASTCDNQSSSGGGNDEIWTLVNPVTQPVLITLTAATTFDGAIRLTSTVCDLATQVPDDIVSGDSGATSDGCADLHASGTAERLNYNWLPAGTYYLVVDGFLASSHGAYTFTVRGGGGTCGNGVLDQNERCDDGNNAAGDGCSATCTVEATYTCTGAPSVCTTTCGNGAINSGETCDDGARIAGDGCGATCQVETGYACTGAPSVCHAIVCGDGVKDTGEACDDGNAAAGDGCSATCQVETGYVCTGTPSVCHAIVCGDGIIDTGEACDDGGTTAGDGCSATCTVEAGYSCSGAPSVCVLACGNGVVDTGEECDAGGTTSMYCDATCHLLFDTTDTEANNTGATAQVITPAHHIIKGSLPADDIDVYQFTLTATSTVKIETYTSYAQGHTNSNSSGVPHLYCPSDDTEIGLFTDAASVSVTDPASSSYHSDDEGDGACSYLVGGGTTLTAGTYWFTVHEYSSAASPTLSPIARYLVDFSVTP